MKFYKNNKFNEIYIFIEMETFLIDIIDIILQYYYIFNKYKENMFINNKKIMKIIYKTKRIDPI